MRVTLTETRTGSPDGIQVVEYQAGETVEMPTELAEVFLREGWAKKPTEPKAKAAPGGATTT